MPIILGYGEDSLSLHALSTGLADILHQLGDDSDPARSLVFFRPSFGRKGPGSSERPRRRADWSAAEFGEFDAIIGTPRGVYLCEAKWKYSGDDQVLDEAQQLRHKVFRAYIEAYREAHRLHSWKNWTEFEALMQPVLQRLHPYLKPAPNNSALAHNLTYILRRLDKCGPAIVDVLLFWKLSEAERTPLTARNFLIVTHLCSREDDSDFVRVPNLIM